MAVVSLGQTFATQMTGVFFDVNGSDLTFPVKLVEARFQPYIFENSDQDWVQLQLYTCGAQSFQGLETSPQKWRLIGSGRLEGMEVLRLSQPINLQAGETHGFCIHAPQRKSLVMLTDAAAAEHTTEGPITITPGPTVTKKQPFTEVDSADRLYVPRGRLVFEVQAPVAEVPAPVITEEAALKKKRAEMAAALAAAGAAAFACEVAVAAQQKAEEEVALKKKLEEGAAALAARKRKAEEEAAATKQATAVVSLGQKFATQMTGVFFDVNGSNLTVPANLVEAHFQPYIFENSDQDWVQLQLYTCGAQSFQGLETSPPKWRQIGSGRLEGMEVLRLSQPINIQAGETHGFCIHAPQRKSLVMLTGAGAAEHTIEGPITITPGPTVTKKQPFTEVDSADRLYVPRGRLVFEMQSPAA